MSSPSIFHVKLCDELERRIAASLQSRHSTSCPEAPHLFTLNFSSKGGTLCAANSSERYAVTVKPVQGFNLQCARAQASTSGPAHATAGSDQIQGQPKGHRSQPHSILPSQQGQLYPLGNVSHKCIVRATAASALQRAVHHASTLAHRNAAVSTKSIEAAPLQASGHQPDGRRGTVRQRHACSAGLTRRKATSVVKTSSSFSHTGHPIRSKSIAITATESLGTADRRLKQAAKNSSYPAVKRRRLESEALPATTWSSVVPPTPIFKARPNGAGKCNVENTQQQAETKQPFASASLSQTGAEAERASKTRQSNTTLPCAVAQTPSHASVPARSSEYGPQPLQANTTQGPTVKSSQSTSPHTMHESYAQLAPLSPPSSTQGELADDRMNHFISDAHPDRNAEVKVEPERIPSTKCDSSNVRQRPAHARSFEEDLANLSRPLANNLAQCLIAIEDEFEALAKRHETLTFSSKNTSTSDCEADSSPWSMILKQRYASLSKLHRMMHQAWELRSAELDVLDRHANRDFSARPGQ